MERRHRMTIEADNGEELLLVCPNCGKRSVLKRSGELVVLDRGDFYAAHSVSRGPVTVGVGFLTSPGQPR